ncbi:MAG TPA: coagulation factor 5/8 type domain-containing protein, partial [Polyangiaceae bacterium]
SWDGNKSNNGLIVNGNGVTAYGLFVEHFQQFQTLWNGNGGATYFYQSELPYDVPTQSDWQHDGINGYASYKIGDNVTSHDARGLGVYCVFDNAITSANAVETPTAANVKIQHIVTLRFGGANGSGINHIINGTGNAVNSNAMSARSAN